MKKELDINDILDEDTTTVNSLSKKDREAKSIEIAEKFKSKGRPKLAEDEKTKPHPMRWTDPEWEVIKKYAEIYPGLKTPSDFIRFCVNKEIGLNTIR